MVSTGGAHAGEADFVTGLSHASGRFGATEPTRVTAASATILIDAGGWNLEASQPYLNVDTAGLAVDLGGVVLPGGVGERITGFGDATVKAGRTVYLDAVGVDLTASMFAKLPTGASHLSTGKADGGFDVELAYVAAAFSPYFSAGYRSYGDTVSLRLEDGWIASAGVTISVQRYVLIASYERSQSPLGGPDPEELFAAASGPINNQWGWTAFASRGLSSGSADYLAGVALRRKVRW